jgi:hypothetical protein
MSKEDKKSGAHLNRHSFLKGVAATGAIAHHRLRASHMRSTVRE